MFGTLPGTIGVAALAGIKFAGYWFGTSAVKHFETTIAASAMKIAAVRTALGFVLGPSVALAGVLLAHAPIFRSRFYAFQGPAAYIAVFIARILIWALVLSLFTRKMPLPKSRLWPDALLGTAVSSLLDLLAYALAIATPEQILFS